MNNEKIILTASVEEINGKKATSVAKKKGICVDNPTISIFSSVLCECELPNSNKIRLAEDAVKEAVESLIGCQVNFNHIGRGNICGFIFDSFINKKKQVVISCVFFKKIYALEYEHAKKLFAKGELTMSYELTADLDTQEKLSDGTRRIHDFYFTGAGLLLGEEPACKNAVVHEFAKKMENERQELIFASKNNLKNILKNRYEKMDSILASLISRLNLEQSEKGGKSIVTIEEIKAKLTEELGDLVAEWTDEDFQNEEKIAEARKTKEESAKKTEEKSDEQATTETEEKAEKTVLETEEKVNKKVTYDDEKKEETVESEYEIEVRRDGKVIRTEKTNNETVYMFAQVEEIKADYEKQINELKATLEVKDSEIEEVRKNAEKIAKLKIENAENEFTKEFKDEDWLNAEKVEEANEKKARKEKIQANKEALKDNEFAKDFTDEDYANDDKVANVKLQAELKAKEEKIKELEAKTSEEEPKEEKEEDVEATKKDEEDLETNHEEDVTATEKKEENILAEMIKSKYKK